MNPYRGTAPFQKSSRTSKAAAMAQIGKRLTTRERVVKYIWGCGASGATRDEIAIALGLRLSSVCGRVAEEMQRDDAHSRIRQLSETRLTSAGAQAFVLVAVTPVDARQIELLERGPYAPRTYRQPHTQAQPATRRRRHHKTPAPATPAAQANTAGAPRLFV